MEHCTFCGHGYNIKDRTRDHPKKDTHCSKRCMKLAAMTPEELRIERGRLK